MATVIIVDYNSIDRTASYIKMIKDKFVNIEQLNFVVVDNYKEKSSLDDLFSYDCTEQYKDKELKIYRYEDSNVVYCFSGDNLGYAKGNNLGAQISDQLFQDEFYVFSNNDLIFREVFDWKKIEKIYEKNPDICLVGPKIVTPQGAIQSPCGEMNAFTEMVTRYWALPPFDRLLSYHNDLDYTNESKYCYRISGCFIIAKADSFRQAGMFDSHTFMFGEEKIIAERLKKIGKKVYFYNDYTLLHNHGQTVKSNVLNLNPERWLHESLLYFYKEYKNLNPIVEKVSNLSFSIYLIRRKIRSKIKSFIK